MLRYEGGKLVGTLNDLFDAVTNPSLCINCGIKLSKPLVRVEKLRCDVCDSISESLQTPYFTALHAEWVRENEDRIVAKRRMLYGNNVA